MKIWLDLGIWSDQIEQDQLFFRGISKANRISSFSNRTENLCYQIIYWDVIRIIRVIDGKEVF